MNERYDLGSPRTRCQALDRAAIDELGLPSMLLMEHASIGAALLALQALVELGCATIGARVLVLCGPGNNGADGFAIARHLAQAGAQPEVWDLVDAARHSPTGDRARQRMWVERLGLPVEDVGDRLPAVVQPVDLVVDALFGTGLDRPPAGRYARAIDWLGQSTLPVLAVDLPSGLDADRGVPLGCAVRARWTATFGLIKRGFLAPGASAFTGQVFCVPIGLPRAWLPAGAPTFPPWPVPFAPCEGGAPAGARATRSGPMQEESGS